MNQGNLGWQFLQYRQALNPFNYILMSMTAVGVGGVREEQIAEIGKSLEIFKKVCSFRDPMPVRMLGIFDKYSGIDRSLYIKTLLTNEHLLRLGKARPAWTNAATRNMQFGQFMSVVGGIASIVKGVANYDFSSISEGCGNISGVVQFYTRDRKQFDCIELMSTLSTNDFGEFKNTFFDNTLEKNKDEIFHQRQEAFTYFLIATLDKTVKNTHELTKLHVPGSSICPSWSCLTESEKMLISQKSFDVETSIDSAIFIKDSQHSDWHWISEAAYFLEDFKRLTNFSNLLLSHTSNSNSRHGHKNVVEWIQCLSILKELPSKIALIHSTTFLCP
jgi:hypothetical protein